METETNHAIENAKNWLASIQEMVGKLSTKNETERENAQEEIQQSVLSVGVRCSTFVPVGNKIEPDEFEILLSTGGPALRIIGELSQYNEPTNSRLEYQDWGTPWIQRPLTFTEKEMVQTFAEKFYFGE